MKSKLTLRIRNDVKARAKAIAAQRGTSVSQLVETYFQMLFDRAPEEVASAEETDVPDASSGTSSKSTREDDLSPRVQALRSALGQPAPNVNLDVDTRRWTKHAAAKHE